MTFRQWLVKSAEVGVAIVVAILTIPVLLLFTCVTFLGAVAYVPFHFWTTVRQAIRLKADTEVRDG